MIQALITAHMPAEQITQQQLLGKRHVGKAGADGTDPGRQLRIWTGITR